jgi:hypothetical protein
MRTALFLVGGVALFALQGCGSTLSQPFESMKSAPITVYRLQNFEPPAATAAAPTAAAPFQLPPEIQQWVTAGAALLPPGLLPPGLLPGAAAPVAQPQAQRFHNFLILGMQPVNDSKSHDEMLDILGHSSSFVAQHDNCMYAEFGISIAQMNGAPPDDILVSLSCDQVAATDFQWPYANTGFNADVAKRFVEVFKKTFGGG